MLAGGAGFVTTNHVVGETFTLLRIVKGYGAAAAFLDVLQASRRLERIFVTRETESRAFELLHRYREHPLSFVDGTSFAVMREGRLRHAFAFDRQFATAGFVRVPADVPAEQVR